MKSREEKPKGKTTGRGEAKAYKCHCPFCKFMESFSHERKRPHAFWEHLDRAQVELLEAFRSLIDHKIDRVKRKKQEASEGLSKIEIEEGEG